LLPADEVLDFSWKLLAQPASVMDTRAILVSRNLKRDRSLDERSSDTTMQRGNQALEFEKPIYELEAQIEEIQKQGNEVEHSDELRELRRQLVQTTKEIYANLTPWETVRVSRHPNRPQTADYVPIIFDEFVELHGDRRFGDDHAMLTGFAKLGGTKIMFVGHQKGRNVKERTDCYFGCAHPEGYRKALLKIQMAAKYGIPVVCFIDTPGAYPGVGAEERGQSQAIAENMFEMSRIPTPIVCVVIGEGGSGGALGIGVGDRVAMLENSYYSVISPEGCAGILWKSHEFKEQAAKALRFRSDDLQRLGVVDEVIPEPLGGAHRDHHQMAANIKRFVQNALRELSPKSPNELLDDRYDRFRKIGVFLESTTGATTETTD
jgi:acetyl-CoA carboxylase carboxyl transferase subunit alpha